MAAADEILGISGQMDISDIQASLDKLCDGLNRVGVDTEALSQRMNKALNDVAQSDEDLTTKTTKAMQVLKSAMDEATKGIQVVPEMIDTANKRVETIEGTIGKLNEQLAKTEKGSEAFGSLTKQIDAQKHSLELAKGDVKDLVESYDGVRNSISQVNGAYQALSAFSVASTSANGVQSATNIAVGATATTAATATSAEAAAHVANAEAATQNAEAENQNVEATRHLTEALQQYISVASGRAEIERMQSESTKELKADMKLYEKTIEDIQNKLSTTDFAKNIEEATKKIEVQKSKIESYKNALANLSAADNETGNGANYYNQLIEKAQANIDTLQSKINDWQTEQQRLNADLQQYNALLEAANKIQGGSTIVQSDATSTVKINVEDTSLSELTSKIDESKQKLQDLEAEASKMDGKPLGEKQKEDLQKLQSEIEKTKNNISVLQEAIREKNEETFIGRLRNQISDFGQKISDFGQSIKDKITQPIDELKAKVSGSSIGQRFSEEFAQAKSGLSDFKDGIINVMTANGKLQGEIGKVGEAFKALGIPVTGSLTAIKSVTKALWGMCATPVGAVIAAIALAFKAVHTWMTKSAEGQKVYTKLMAYFGSLAKSITDIVIIFGEYLYKCFTKPNAPLRDFGNNFVKTFKTAVKAAVNLIGGLGTTIKGVLNMDWDTFTAGLKKTWDGIKGAGETVIDVFKTGVSGAIGAVKTAYDAFTNEDLSKKLGAAFNGILSKAEQAASLAGKIQETQIAINKNKETQLKLDGKIAEARNKIYTLQGKEKIAAIEEAKALVKQKYDFQIKQQQQLVELHEKQAKLHTQSLKDIAAERELRMQVLRTQVQQNSEQRMLIRQEEAAKRSLANKSKTDAKKDATQQKQINSAEGKLDDVIYKNAYERAKAWQSLEQEVTDAKIKAMKEGEEKVIAERKRELSKEIEQIEERKNAAIKAERDRQKAEFDAQQSVIKAKGGKAETWDDKKHLDSKNIKKITEQYTIIEQKTIESYNNEIYADELKSYREYLKEYGNLEQQKLAIVEEYNEKIKEARAKGNLFEEAKLKTDLEEQLKKLNFNDFKDSINWDSVFSDMGRLGKSYLEDLRKKLKDLLGSGTLDIDDMKVVSEQIGKIDDAISEQTDKWGWSNEKVREHNRLLQEAADAQERLNLAQGKLDKEQRSNENLKEYIQYIFRSKGVDVQTGDITSQNKEKLLGNKSLFSEAELSKLKGLFDELAVSEVKVGKATKDVKNAQEDANVSQNKARKSINEIANEWAESIGNVAKKLQEASELIDALGFGDSDLGKKLKSGADAFNKGSQAASDFATGNYIGAAINGVGAIKSLGSALGIGNGSNAKEVAETTNRLTESNERLQYSIEQLKSSIDKTSGMSAVSNYQKAYDAQKQINKQSMEILQSQMGYHGSHHSNAYYWNLSAQDYAAINRTLAQQSAVRGGYINSTINKVNSLEDIYKLTPEQMKDIRTYNQDVWKNMTDQGKYDKTEYWENYTDLAEKLEELTDKINQNLTQTTFDSLKDNFISNLMDMSKSAQDFANDFTTMLNKSMLNFAVDDLANKRLKALYEKWADKMKQGQLSNDDLDILKKEYDNIVDEGLKIRDNIAAITGYKEAQSQQTATGKGIEAITADQASSLIGIGYAVQIAQEQGNEVRKAIAVDVSFLRIYAEQTYNNISEMRDIQYQGLEQLEAINKNTAPIILIREDIASMYKLMKDKY
uniref:Tape measure domain protein n=1 Tax=Siphoviridae sp. ctKwY15 TaxID=2827843 RepID=A0A8S5SUQ2_9CAUD|nr:MAG TPA: Tape measure domain protein [Siphoviridae sp. ctKwY15]